MKTMKFVVFGMVATFVGCISAQDTTPVASTTDQSAPVVANVSATKETTQDVSGVAAPAMTTTENSVDTMQPEVAKPTEDVIKKDAQPVGVADTVAPVQSVQDSAKTEMDEVAKPVSQPVEPVKKEDTNVVAADTNADALETAKTATDVSTSADDKKEESKESVDKELEAFLNMLSQDKKTE